MKARLESPMLLADRVGQAYVNTCEALHRKSRGIYLTPPPVATFMAQFIHPRQVVRVLDPAAGAGILLCAGIEWLVSQPCPPHRIEVTAFETEEDLARQLLDVLLHAAKWAKQKGVEVVSSVFVEDFIEAKGLSLLDKRPGDFDAVIGNPPYFKISKEDPRAIIAQSVVHGQPNIYGLFMAVGAAQLRPEGEFVFITPRSFASGQYFARLREEFFSLIEPEHVHIFSSRREAFRRDAVLQENIILSGTRKCPDVPLNSDRQLTISTSEGLADLFERKHRMAPLGTVLDPSDPAMPLRLPISDDDEQVLRLFSGWNGSLQAYGLEISTGPVVAFRAASHLSKRRSEHTAPLLWLSHVRAMNVHWPNGVQKPQYIADIYDTRNILVSNGTYVLLRRFSAKEEARRLTAAPLVSGQLDAEVIGIENHLNFIHRRRASIMEEEAFGLAALLNSTLFDTYFRSISGNTQVSATEIRAMPIPPLNLIKRLGSQVRQHPSDLAMIDSLVNDLVATEFDKEHGNGGHVKN